MALGGIAKEQEGAEAILKASSCLCANVSTLRSLHARCSYHLSYEPSKAFPLMILRCVAMGIHTHHNPSQDSKLFAT